MNTQTEQVIRDTVSDFVNKGFLFTAFDITRAIRDDGVTAYHSEAKEVVADIFGNGDMTDYTRTSVDVGVKVNPLVYHHEDADATAYESDWFDNNPNQNGFKHDSSTASTASVTSANGYIPLSQIDGSEDEDEDDAEDDQTVAISTNQTQKISNHSTPKGNKVATKEGRLQLPINLIRKVGLTPYSPAWVHYEMGSHFDNLKVVKNRIDSSDYLIQVNKDGRIRICQSVLKQLGSSTCYRVTESNSAIVITP